MYPELWVNEVLSRWPYKGSKSEKDMEAVKDDLLSFSGGRSPEELKEIYDTFSHMKPPSGFGMWWFWNQVSKPGDSDVWWRVCSCGKPYQDRGSRCPVCGSYEYRLSKGDIMPTETVMVQESCGNCKWYDQAKTQDGTRLYGPECKEYGKAQETRNTQICRDCKCRDCCNMAFTYYNNKEEYKEKYGVLIEKRMKEIYEMVKNGPEKAG